MTAGGRTNSSSGRSTARYLPPEDDKWSAVWALSGGAGLSALILGVTVALLWFLDKETSGGPEEALSLVFVAAAVVLILVVCTLTIVLKRLRLVDDKEAMGLPRGSIRAVIALMLILLFFIAAIFLFNSTRQVPPNADEVRSIEGLDQARFLALPTEIIYRSEQNTNDAGTVTYDVELLPSPLENEASDDLALQLLTVLGTLVTAVAAFYFGSASVSAAVASEREKVADGELSAVDVAAPAAAVATGAAAAGADRPERGGPAPAGG